MPNPLDTTHIIKEGSSCAQRRDSDRTWSLPTPRGEMKSIYKSVYTCKKLIKNNKIKCIWGGRGILNEFSSSLKNFCAPVLGPPLRLFPRCQARRTQERFTYAKHEHRQAVR